MPDRLVGMQATLLIIGTADGLLINHAAGTTLRRVAHVLAGQAIATVSALDADTLLVGCSATGAFQSFDGGQHWLPAPTAPEPIGLNAATRTGPLAVANPRLMGATAYAYLGGKRAVLLGAGAGGTLIFRSEDEGIHWQPATLPEPIGPVATLVPDARNATYAWAGTATGQLLVTTDDGRSWRIAARDLPPITCIVSLTPIL